NRQPERIGATAADHSNLAEMQAEAALELVVEFGVRECDDPLGGGGLLGPDEGGAPAAERQDGEGAGGEEMLLGTALVIALMGDCGDDGGLAIGPAVDRNAGELAQARAGAVGGDQQACGHAPSVRE